VSDRAKQPRERDAHIFVVLDEDQSQRAGDGQREFSRNRRILHCNSGQPA
jgi:hypothetical protein